MSAAEALTVEDLARLPGKRDEDWRWTDLRGLIRQPRPRSPELGPVQAGGPFAGLTGDEVVIANGRLNWWPEDKLSPGVQVAVKSTPSPPMMATALRMGAFAADMPVTIITFVADGAALALRIVSEANEAAHHARIGVVVKAGVSATLLESYEGADADYVSNTLVEVFLEEGAALERVVVAEDGPDSVGVSTAEAHLSSASRFRQTVLAGGAKRQRIETWVDHPGHGASVRMDGAYLLADKRHADITTVVSHNGVDGQTSQLIKGVVHDQARGIFQGRIVVAEGADRTDARMGHHALILSERAEVDAKPELLIFADDVQCAHGNTIGALDENAIFYARQRGIPDDEARAMLTQAFVGEVIDRIEHHGARDAARGWATKRLGGG